MKSQWASVGLWILTAVLFIGLSLYFLVRLNINNDSPASIRAATGTRGGISCGRTGNGRAARLKGAGSLSATADGRKPDNAGVGDFQRRKFADVSHTVALSPSLVLTALSPEEQITVLAQLRRENAPAFERQAVALLHARAGSPVLSTPASEVRSGSTARSVDDATVAVSVSAIEYLGRIRSTLAFNDIFSLASDSRNARVRASAIRNLALVGGREHVERVVDLLARTITDADPVIRAESIRILGRFSSRITPAIRTDIKKQAQMRADSPDERRAKARAAELLNQLRLASE